MFLKYGSIFVLMMAECGQISIIKTHKKKSMNSDFSAKGYKMSQVHLLCIHHYTALPHNAAGIYSWPVPPQSQSMKKT